MVKEVAGQAYLALATYEGIYSKLWNAIYEVIQDNVNDPKNRTDFKWIWSAYPTHEINEAENSSFDELKNFYPLIVISPVESSYEPLVLNGATIDRTIRFSIEIYSDSLANLDKLADSIDEQIRAHKDYFAARGLTSIALQSTEFANFTRSGLVIYVKVMRYRGVYSGA